jgi:hypothetical protein
MQDTGSNSSPIAAFDGHAFRARGGASEPSGDARARRSVREDLQALRTEVRALSQSLNERIAEMHDLLAKKSNPPERSE